jgi:hypothetical protein
MACWLPLLFYLREAQGGDNMATTWKPVKTETNSKSSGAARPTADQHSAGIEEHHSSWSRAQKLGVIACLTMVGILLAISACSKQSSKSAAAGVSGPASASAALTTTAASPATAMTAASAGAPDVQARAKKPRRKLSANVTYRDANSGVSFVYPRKFVLASGDKGVAEDAAAGKDLAGQASGEKAQPAQGMDNLPMNFVEPRGTAVATVALPENSYPGTDFAAGLFRVNVNRNLAANECQHFAFVDANDADGEPIDAERVKVGATEMNMTSEFEGSAMHQVETRYYHDYENGACYEYVLGLATDGFGAEANIRPVDRDQVFGRLEKILATVKVRAEEEQVAEKRSEPKQLDAKQSDAKQTDGKQMEQKPGEQKPSADAGDAAAPGSRK